MPLCFTLQTEVIFLPNFRNYVYNISPTDNRKYDNLNFHHQQNLISIYVIFYVSAFGVLGMES
jgi:hypothetical protein